MYPVYKIDQARLVWRLSFRDARKYQARTRSERSCTFLWSSHLRCCQSRVLSKPTEAN
jgi:hypothetical protein